MAAYRVKPGHALPQDGVLFTAGAIVELSPLQAAEVEIACHVEPIDMSVVGPAEKSPRRRQSDIVPSGPSAPTEE